MTIPTEAKDEALHFYATAHNSGARNMKAYLTGYLLLSNDGRQFSLLDIEDALSKALKAVQL